MNVHVSFSGSGKDRRLILNGTTTWGEYKAMFGLTELADEDLVTLHFLDGFPVPLAFGPSHLRESLPFPATDDPQAE